MVRLHLKYSATYTWDYGTKTPNCLVQASMPLRSFLLTKTITQLDSYITKFLMALVNRHIESIDDLMLSIYKSVSNAKGDSLIPFRHPLGCYFITEVQGSVNLAYFLDDKLRVYMADLDATHYCKEYTDFLAEHRFSKSKACFAYQNELSVLNTLLSCIPTTRIYQDRNKTVTDTERCKNDRLKLVKK